VTDHPVWIDTDPGLGLFGVDVDDAIATLALHCAGLRIAGLSTCFGNAALSRVHRVARDLGRRLDLPVARGAKDPTDVGTEAVDALVAHRGVVLALAPLTNVAAALARGARWERLIVLGGTTARGPNVRRLRTTELNLAADLGAAAAVIEAKPDLVPMEPCRRVWFGLSDVVRFPEPFRARSLSWLALAPLHSRRLAFCPWDLVAAMWLVEPSFFTVVKRAVHLVADRWRKGHVTLSHGGDLPVVADVDGPRLRARFHHLLAHPRPRSPGDHP